MSLKERLQSGGNRSKKANAIFQKYGVVENPFPAAGQTMGHPRMASEVDEQIEAKIESFIRDKKSEIIVIEGTQGVGKTNLLSYYEQAITEVIPEIGGYYVIRYMADPEASFDGTLRRLFQELGIDHLLDLGRRLRDKDSAARGAVIELAKSHEIRMALGNLADATEDSIGEVASLFLEWLLGVRVLNKHKAALGVHFRLDTVESRTLALRDIVYCSSEAGILNGIFLLLDELEKQDGVLSPTYVVRYLSAMRAIIDALPNHLFMMIAVTPDAFRRYSSALPAFQSRLQDRIQLEPLTHPREALQLATFYLKEAQSRAANSLQTKPPAAAKPIVTDAEVERIFTDLFKRATTKGDTGLRQREFLHALHLEAEKAIEAL